MGTHNKHTGRPPGRPPGVKNQVAAAAMKDITNMATTADVKAIVKRLANHVLKKEITAAQCSALNGLLLTWVKLYELEDLIARLERIERQMMKKNKRLLVV